MNQSRGSSPSSPPSAPRRWRAIMISTVVLTTLVALVWLAMPAHLRAEQHPGGDTANPVILNIAIARPAVVRIATQYRFTASFQLCPGVTDTFDDALAFTGSGVFISGNGDILTADHVMNTPPELVAGAALQIEVPQLYSDLKAKCAKVMNTDFLTLQQTLDYFIEHPSLVNVVASQPTSRVWLNTAYVGAYTQTTLRTTPSYPPTIKAESPYNKNDVAIIHIGLTDTPSLPLGESTDLAPTDTLSLIGFPGNGDVNANPTDFLTESVNQITVSALKQNPQNGGSLIQVGGNVEHGDSGGPALNSRGEIVGIVSFGLSDLGATRFLQASSSVKPLIAQVSLDLTPSVFQTQWHQAMVDYAASTPGHWHKAVSDFQALSAAYPKFVGVQPYLTYSQTQAQSEAIPQAQPKSQVTDLSVQLIILVASGVLLLLAVIILIVSLTGRGRRARRAEQAKLAAIAAMPQASAPYPMAAALVPVAAGDMTAPRPVVSAPWPSAPAEAPWLGSVPPGNPYQPLSAPLPGNPYQPLSAPLPGNPYPPAGYMPSSAPVPPSAYPMGGDPPPPVKNNCINGHYLPPNATYCVVCGAARA